MNTRLAKPDSLSGHPLLRDPGFLAFLVGVSVASLVLFGGPGATGLVGIAALVLLILIYPIVGVGAILLSAPTSLLLSPYIPKGLPFSFLLLVLTAVGLGLRRVYEPRSAPFRWNWVDGLAAFLLINGLLYLPMARNLKTGMYGYHEVFRLFLLYFVVRLLAPGPGAQRGLLWLVGITAFGVTGYGCIQPFWGYEDVMVAYDLVESLKDYAGFDSGRVARAYSILVSPLSLGFTGMVGALSAVAILIVPNRNDAAARLAPLLLLVSAGASALSYTRSSWLGTAAALGIAVVTIVRPRDRWLLVAGPAVLGLGILRFVPALADQLARYALTIASQDPRDTSLHYVALVAAARFFWGHMQGVGLGAASFAGFNHAGGVTFWSENTYFQMGIQTGAQSLVALAAFLVVAALAGFRLARDPSAARRYRRLGAAVFLGLIGFSVAGVAIPTLPDVAPFGPLWVMTALVLNTRDTPPERSA